MVEFIIKSVREILNYILIIPRLLVEPNRCFVYLSKKSIAFKFKTIFSHILLYSLVFALLYKAEDYRTTLSILVAQYFLFFISALLHSLIITLLLRLFLIKELPLNIFSYFLLLYLFVSFYSFIIEYLFQATESYFLYPLKFLTGVILFTYALIFLSRILKLKVVKIISILLLFVILLIVQTKLLFQLSSMKEIGDSLNDPISVEFIENGYRLDLEKLNDDSILPGILFTTAKMIDSISVKDTNFINHSNIVLIDTIQFYKYKNGTVSFNANDLLKYDNNTYIFAKDVGYFLKNCREVEINIKKNLRAEIDKNEHAVIITDTLLANTKFKKNKKVFESYRAYLSKRKEYLKFYAISDSIRNDIPLETFITKLYDMYTELLSCNIEYNTQAVERYRFINNYRFMLLMFDESIKFPDTKRLR